MAPPTMRSPAVMVSGSAHTTCLIASLKVSFSAVSGAIFTCSRSHLPLQPPAPGQAIGSLRRQAMAHRSRLKGSGMRTDRGSQLKGSGIRTAHAFHLALSPASSQHACKTVRPVLFNPALLLS